MDGREAAEAVLERLSDGDRGCRVAAGELVRQWGLETLLTAGRSLLLRPSTRARLTAVTALALFPRPEVVGLLEWALCDPEPDVAALARQTLQKMVEMGQRGAGEALDRAAEQAPLIALASTTPTDMPPADPLDSPAPFWRINEIIRITKVDDRTRISDLLDRLPRERDPFVTATLVNALARLEARQAVPFLRSYLVSGDSRVRANTVEAVGRLGTPEDRALLIRFFKDANNRVRANAVVACHGLPGVDVRPVLVEMLASEDVWMRKSALYAIRALGDPELARLLNPSERADTAPPAS
jgi:HEAT repeat protein